MVPGHCLSRAVHSWWGDGQWRGKKTWADDVGGVGFSVGNHKETGNATLSYLAISFILSLRTLCLILKRCFWPTTTKQIRNLGDGRTCLDSAASKKDLKKPVGLYPCHKQGGNQVIIHILFYRLSTSWLHVMEESGNGIYITLISVFYYVLCQSTVKHTCFLYCSPYLELMQHIAAELTRH